MSFKNFLTESQEDEMFDKTIKLLTESNVVRMDRNTMRKRLFTQATLAAAREANDPFYIKYNKHNKLRKKYRRLIQERFAAQGRRKLAEYDARRRANSGNRKP